MKRTLAVMTMTVALTLTSNHSSLAGAIFDRIQKTGVITA
ncbi:MAG: amino acid ABC transporter substrate-binding protein, partial [Microcystis sp. M49636_WE2]|nr:amino acid ABC transporter substrate-binding protein [Microcystis sp. M49636_WE2]